MKICNVDGFNGSFWYGGVGNVCVDCVCNIYIVVGSVYGISSKKFNMVVLIDFNIFVEC